MTLRKQTVDNLAKAFIGESQARNRYNFYARTARAEGYEEISAIILLVILSVMVIDLTSERLRRRVIEAVA